MWMRAARALRALRRAALLLPLALTAVVLLLLPRPPSLDPAPRSPAPPAPPPASDNNIEVYINPKLKVIDYKKIIHSEGCESVQGYAADVPRYKAVQVTGFNAEGVEKSQVYRDWSARIAQHEMDHLDGKIYTDIMDRKTLTCSCWEEVNLSKGKLVIPFSPQ